MSTPEKTERFRKWMPILIGCSSLFVIGAVLVGAVVLFSIAEGMLVFIAPTERGVVFSLYEPRGYRSDVLQPGYHLLRPGEEVELYDISRQTYTMSAVSDTEPDSVEAHTNDGQEVLVDVSVTYAVDPEKILDLYVTWRDTYRNGVVRPITRSTTRDIVAQYKAEDILGHKRAEAQEIIATELKTKLAENYLRLFEFTIQDIRVSQ